MSERFAWADDTLSAADRATLQVAAARLWDDRQAIAAEWAHRLVAALPEYFPQGAASLAQVAELNGVFLEAVLTQMQSGNLAGLAETFYDMNRNLIEIDLQMSPQRPISLGSLYTSARISQQILAEHVGRAHQELVMPWATLATQLMTLVGLAYSDVHEAALERDRAALERIVEERTAALRETNEALEAEIAERRHVEASLRRESALSDTIIETLPGLFFVIDESARVVRWNHELEKVSGYSAEEIAARHPLDYFSPDARQLLAGKLEEAFSAGTATAEADLVAKDGTLHSRLFTSKRVQLDRGVYLVGVGIDIAERRRAEERVQREKGFSDTIIDTLPGIFYLFDQTARFLRWNDNFERVSQHTATEMAGMSPLDFFDGEGRVEVETRIGEVFRNGYATAQADFVAKDGTRTPYFFTGQRVIVDDQVCCIGMGIDVTERKRAEEALQRARTAQLFASLLESAPDAVVVTDRRGAIVFANSAAEGLFGYRQEALLGRAMTMLIPAPARLWAPADEAAPAAPLEMLGKRRDGSAFPIEVKLTTLETADGRLLTGAIRDITDRKRAEAEIRNLNIDLERRVAERTSELARSNADLEQFAYVASHDLQEPLRAVASYTQLLARRYGPRLDGDALRFIERTTGAVTRMQQLIRDLLAYSRVGTRGTAVRPTACDALLHDVLDDLQAAVAETGAVVTADPLPVLPADASQLRQVLQNLIANAIKFRGEAAPRVHVRATRHGDRWRFAIADNGIGIESEYAERVFVIFQRLHSRRAYPGTGVGLAICKKIVERHGGSIWFESAAEQGTTFFFELPADDTGERALAVAS